MKKANLHESSRYYDDYYPLGGEQLPYAVSLLLHTKEDRSQMKVAYIEPFYSGSHRQWIDGFARVSKHQIRTFGLPAQNWKWRMQTGAIQLAEELIASEWEPDLIMASDMLDCALFSSLLTPRLRDLPLILYFHENQLTYPWSEKERNIHLNKRYFGFKNYSSCLVADKVFFNSAFHMNSFLEALQWLAGESPDYRHCITRMKIEEKCSVLPLGIDLQSLDIARTSGQQIFPKIEEPILLWNHRWDFDKNPQAFFKVCEQLKRDHFYFKLIVCGEQLDVENPIFEDARNNFYEHILHWGYAEDPRHYAALLWRADFAPITSNQDFFGVSIAEAAYCNCAPLLPCRLSYPEVFCFEEFPQFFYRNSTELFKKLHKPRSYYPLGQLKEFLTRYDWSSVYKCYDLRIENLTV